MSNAPLILQQITRIYEQGGNALTVLGDQALSRVEQLFPRSGAAVHTSSLRNKCHF